MIKKNNYIYQFLYYSSKGKYDFSIKALTEKSIAKQKKSKINDKSKSNKNTGEKTNTEKVKVKTNLFN